MIFAITVGGFVRIGAKRIAEIKTVWIGPDGRVNDGNIFFANFGRVVTVVFIETFFECVIHGVDSGFAVFVAGHSIKIGFLDEKQNKRKRCKNRYDDKFNDGETFFVCHNM